MDDEKRDECLTEIRIKVVQMATDIAWLKRILATAAIIVAAAFGIDLKDTFIHV